MNKFYALKFNPKPNMRRDRNKRNKMEEDNNTVLIYLFNYSTGLPEIMERSCLSPTNKE